MEKTINSKKHGKLVVRNAMFDTDGTSLEEGIEIKSLEGNFELIEIYGYYDVDDLSKKRVNKLIDDNIN